ncbi:MAG: J domain-containing protein [Thermogemmatispora sp.]|uniref:DnaJ domain-containing protein n=1 Tax=Thermogemmatispora sp. TaxID=1968838 RepID=UPI002636F97F|nr:DnaJ domain-containing protein [Thermogemmatispora sp.]MBX5457235.1 J domain-containing protein [Thermogemmatispora sp.]
MQDYYSILEIAPTASPEEIRRAYLRLVRRYHPDAHQNAAGMQARYEQQMKLINEAYEVLGDPRRRATYDVHRAAELRVRALREARLKYQAQMGKHNSSTEMTWLEGLVGFVRELKRSLRED